VTGEPPGSQPRAAMSPMAPAATTQRSAAARNGAICHALRFVHVREILNGAAAHASNACTCGAILLIRHDPVNQAASIAWAPDTHADNPLVRTAQTMASATSVSVAPAVFAPLIWTDASGL
jgi:hypothetical protein